MQGHSPFNLPNESLAALTARGAASRHLQVCSVSHCDAGVFTALARLCATLAVVHAVLAALRCAAAARLRTESADGLHVFTAPGDRRSGKPANIGAFQIQSNTARHGLGVGLPDAGRRALQACGSAFVTCAQACFLELVEHWKSLK